GGGGVGGGWEVGGGSDGVLGGDVREHRGAVGCGGDERAAVRRERRGVDSPGVSDQWTADRLPAVGREQLPAPVVLADEQELAVRRERDGQGQVSRGDALDEAAGTNVADLGAQRPGRGG